MQMNLNDELNMALDEIMERFDEKDVVNQTATIVDGQVNLNFQLDNRNFKRDVILTMQNGIWQLNTNDGSENAVSRYLTNVLTPLTDAYNVNYNDYYMDKAAPVVNAIKQHIADADYPF